MKVLMPLFALAFIGTAQAQVPQVQPATVRNGDVRVQSVPAPPAPMPRAVRQRTSAAEPGSPLPTFLDRSKQEYFDQIPLFRDAQTFRNSETLSTPPSTTEGLAEALGSPAADRVRAEASSAGKSARN